jgi:hypothetical protein
MIFRSAASTQPTSANNQTTSSPLVVQDLHSIDSLFNETVRSFDSIRL